MNKKTNLCYCVVAIPKDVRKLGGASPAAGLITRAHAVGLTLVLAVGVLQCACGGGGSSTVAPPSDPIFQPFADDSGHVQSVPSDVTISTSLGSIVPVNAPLDSTNKFFDPAFGTNGQACVTCHQPNQGFTINVGKIQAAFAASGGTDPLFRPIDTANNPNVPASAGNYSLFLNMGVVRIGKSLPTSPIPNFTVEPQNTAEFGPLPLANDPQQPGHVTLSLFRRPLINTNVHVDSSVLWDGRASIDNIRAQVIGAAKTLLSASSPNTSDADQVAEFMLGVYTDQVFDSVAGTDPNGNCVLSSCGAGSLSAAGALGGAANLMALALSPNSPCTSFLETPCPPNVPGYSIFNAWSNLPATGTTAAQASVARGQTVFNTVNLIVPSGGIPGLSQAPGSVIHCITCHATGNVGNNPDPTFFVRIGTDSVQILTALAAQDANVQSLLDRVSLLPEYCLRPTSDPTPFTTAPCGTDPNDVKSTDLGQAMVTGNIADVGKFKPPILRGLGVRSPYFHAGAANGIDALIDFYSARFSINLTPDQHVDLASFVEAQ